MPQLLNAESAIIEAEKLRNYILSPTHPIGRFKAVLFRRLGYSVDNWQEFEKNLRNLILTREAIEVAESQYGKKFTVEGPFTGPTSVTIRIITVWVILKSENVPRFVTAYRGEPR